MKSQNEFIAADESGWFIALFDLYVRNLFWRRFHRVWVHQEYQPSKESKTIYYLNHTSWWDGLIPLLLNRKIFRQKARAMMEDRQMREHSFFRKIGAFSVNLEHQRSAIKSLRYAVDSMKKPGASLFIYPEGQIVPFSTENPSFKKGLAWIAKKCPEADVVPIGICIHTANADKPELFISIGQKITFQQKKNPEELKDHFETELGNLLSKLQSNATEPKHNFKRLI